LILFAVFLLVLSFLAISAIFLLLAVSEKRKKGRRESGEWRVEGGAGVGG
jgi:hypothetical protein